eukprot:5430936-Amphidinium_carterae.1
MLTKKWMRQLDVEAWRDPGSEKFANEYTGEEFPRDGVLEARHAEMDFMRDLGVWTYASTKEAVAKTGQQPVDADKRRSRELRS